MRFGVIFEYLHPHVSCSWSKHIILKLYNRWSCVWWNSLEVPPRIHTMNNLTSWVRQGQVTNQNCHYFYGSTSCFLSPERVSEMPCRVKRRVCSAPKHTGCTSAGELQIPPTHTTRPLFLFRHQRIHFSL